jgi:hypothetical protein
MARGWPRRDLQRLQAAGHFLTMWQRRKVSFRQNFKAQTPFDFSNGFDGNVSSWLFHVTG